MSPATLPGFLTKKEVEERFGRSHRTLTRDFSSAVRLNDEQVLSHLKVHTEDGIIRQGTEVTLEEIQQWSNDGLSPTWFVEEAWAAVRYGAKSNPVREQSAVKKEKPSAVPTETSTVRMESSELVRRLEQQIGDLQRDKEKLYEELNIKNEQIKQANERTRESNVLMKELQSLLGDVQKRALLSQPMSPISDATQQPTEVGVIVDEKTSDPSSTPQQKSSSPKGRERAKKGTARQKSKPTPAKTSATEAPSQLKWYDMPTLKKILRRRP